MCWHNISRVNPGLFTIASFFGVSENGLVNLKKCTNLYLLKGGLCFLRHQNTFQMDAKPLYLRYCLGLLFGQQTLTRRLPLIIKRGKIVVAVVAAAAEAILHPQPTPSCQGHLIQGLHQDVPQEVLQMLKKIFLLSFLQGVLNMPPHQSPIILICLRGSLLMEQRKSHYMLKMLTGG